MKKIILALFALIALPLLVLSQKTSSDFTVVNSTPYPVIDAGSKEYVSLNNGTVLYAKMTKGMVYLQIIDANEMKEVARKKYDDLPKKAFFQDMIKMGDRVFYFYEVYDKKAKNYKVYAREINPETAEFMPHKLLLTTSRKAANPPFKGDLTRAEVGFKSLQAGNKFTFSSSFDESKLLVTYRLTPMSKNDSKNFDEIGFYVFDRDMEKVWGKEERMPYTEKNMNNTGYALGGDGSVKMLITNNEEETYEVLNFGTDGEMELNKTGVTAHKFVRNMTIKENKEGKFICGGYYANGYEIKYNPFTGFSKVFNANGLMYFEIDQLGTLVAEKYFEFSKDFIQQNLSDHQKKAVAKREAEGKAGIFDLYMTHFVLKEDGSAVFVGERQYLRNEFWGPSQQNVYHFSNVVVIKVDEQGELAWMVKLAKNQAGLKGAGQMGIAYMPGKDADYVAYIDNPKNIKLGAKEGVPAPHKDGLGGWLTTYKIDYETGELAKHTICDLMNVRGKKMYQFKPWRITKVSEGVFVVETYIKGKKDMTTKFEINN